MRLWWKLHGYEVLLGSPVESYPKNNISMLDHQTDNGLNPTSEIFQHTNLSTDHQSEQKSGGLSYRVANRIWSPTTPERERKSSKKFQEPDSCSFSNLLYIPSARLQSLNMFYNSYSQVTMSFICLWLISNT